MGDGRQGEARGQLRLERDGRPATGARRRPARAGADPAADQGPPAFRGGLDHGRLRVSRQAAARAGRGLHLRRLSDRDHLVASDPGGRGHRAQELARTPLHLVAFGEDRDGELYLVDHDRTHQIYRLVRNPAAKGKSDFPGG